MNVKIVMCGEEKISLIHEDTISVNDYACVINYKSKKRFAYYLNKNDRKKVLQHAVKTADNDITHILFISEGIVLNDYNYDFTREEDADILTDSESWETRKFALIKVTKDTRHSIENVRNVIIGELDKSVFDYDPSIGKMSQKLLEIGCDFNKAVAEIRSFYTYNDTSAKPKIFIGTPCFGAQLSCNYTSSLIRTIELLKINGIDTEIHFLPNQIVTRARNILAYKFLSSNCSHLFFIDADIEWKPEDVLRLINHKKNICVGLYANKAYQNVNTENRFKQIQYSSTFFDENNTMDSNKLMEIKHGATGFMLIERGVFDSIVDLTDEFNYDKVKMNDFFPCKVVDGDYLTEDYAFCQMFREKGGTIWADLSICLNHEGWHSYHGNPLETFSIEK